jgi:hypothetical protein
MDTVEQTSSLRFLTHLLDQLDLAVDHQFADRPPSNAVLRRKTTLGSSVVRNCCNQPSYLLGQDLLNLLQQDSVLANRDLGKVSESIPDVPV